MAKHDPPHDRCRRLSLRDSERHPDGERQVREVGVRRGILLLEVDATRVRLVEVVEARILEGLDRLHQRPRQRDAEHAEHAEKPRPRQWRFAGCWTAPAPP